MQRRRLGGVAVAVPLKDMTLERFLELPEEKPALEFEDGRITQKVSPKGQHSGLQAELVGLINQLARQRKLALAFPELRATFGGRSYVPDISVYRWSRLPVDAAGDIANDFTEPPDLAIEIVSPEQRTTALVRRCLWYVSHGVGIALLVDPADRSVLSFRPDRVPTSLVDSDRIDVDDLLPGFALTVRQLFDSLRVE
jgi:Uma2 family endonuclease